MRHDSRGFNLIEVVMAMFILLCGFLVVAKVNPLGYQGAAVTRDRLIALRIARNTIDKVRSLPLGSSVTSLQGPVPMTGDYVEGAQVGLEFAVKEVVVTVPTSSGPTPIGLGTVNVTVEWRDPSGSKSSTGTKTLTMVGGLSREP